MDFVKGDRVRFLGRPDWGPGFVLQNSNSGKVWVRFEQAGTKLLILRYAKLLRVRTDIPGRPVDAPPLPLTRQA